MLVLAKSGIVGAKFYYLDQPLISFTAFLLNARVTGEICMSHRTGGYP